MRWSAVIETGKSFVTADVNPAAGNLDAATRIIIAKPPETAATLAAKRSYLGRVYLDWARYRWSRKLSKASTRLFISNICAPAIEDPDLASLHRRYASPS